MQLYLIENLSDKAKDIRIDLMKLKLSIPTSIEQGIK